MVTISKSDGAKLDFKRCSSGDLGRPFSAPRLGLLMDRDIRNLNSNALKAFNVEVKCCLTRMLRLASELEGA